MKIAVVGSGRSVHAHSCSAAMAGRGHDVRLVTMGSVLPSERIELRTRPAPSGLRGSIRAARGFLDDIRSFRPDVLHVHSAGGRLGTLATLAGVRPMVVTVADGDVLAEERPRRPPSLEHRATRRVLEEADLILLRSEALRPALAHFGALRARVETVRWGVDPARFQRHTADGEAMRRRLELSARDRVLLSPRNLTADSNGTLMIEAMPRVLRAVPHALLLFAEGQADPAYRDGLIGRSLDLGLGDRVRFLGRVEHADMPALYSLAEAVVNIPSADGLTQSLFEAMACEAPLLLGRLPAYAEVVADGDSVLMVDFTADAVAAGMVRLLSDRVVRTWLAGRALARVREVALLPRDAERVEGYYRQLVASRSRRRSRSRTLDALSLFVR